MTTSKLYWRKTMEKKQIYAIAVVAIIVIAAIAGAAVLLNKNKSSSKEINTLDDLNGATIGTIKGYTGDTLIIGTDGKYPIVRRSPQVLWFENPNGDVVKLNKSNDSSDALAFTHENRHTVPIITEVVKKDTVVMYAGERYHCYIAINPTKYKVVNTAYNPDGVAVDNVYYDNIIHLSIYKGGDKLYSKDIDKRMYSRFVPKQILSQSILSGMEFYKTDSRGFHFNTTVCIPDNASCYMLDTYVSLKGQVAMELIEY